MFFDVLLLLCAEWRHRRIAAIWSIIIWRRWVVRTWRLLFLFFHELLREYVEFLDWVIVCLIPPVIFPVSGSSQSFFTKSKILLSSFDLHTICIAVLVFAKPISFFPAHVHHKFLGILTFEANIGHAWALQKSVSIFAWHQQLIIYIV